MFFSWLILPEALEIRDGDFMEGVRSCQRNPLLKNIYKDIYILIITSTIKGTLLLG